MRDGPFRVVESAIKGRVTSTKQTATSLLLFRDGRVAVGTLEGHVVLHSDKQESVAIVLKSKKPVSKLVQATNGLILALCGGEVFTLDDVSLTRKLAFQNLRDVVDIAPNQRGPPDWGVCLVTATQEDGALHLFADLGSKQFELLRDIPLKGCVGRPTQVCWYENVICLGGTKAAVLLDDVQGTWKKVPIAVNSTRGPIILPLSEGRILLDSAGGIGVVIDLQGDPVPNVGAIAWTASPVAIAKSGPYVISLMDNGVLEVATSVSPGTVVQRLTIPHAARVLASDDGLIGELLFESNEVERSFAFVLGLMSQHSDTPFKKVQVLPLKERLLSMLEADSGDVTRSLNLIKESFPNIYSPAVKELENFTYTKGAFIHLNERRFQRALQLMLNSSFHPGKLLSCVGIQLPDDEEQVQDAIDPGVRHDVEFVDFIYKFLMEWRLQHGGESKLDTLIVFFLASKNDLFEEQLESFCMDATNVCNLEMASDKLAESGLDLCVVHLQSVRLGSSVAVMDACAKYQALDQPKHVLRVLLSVDKGLVDVSSLQAFVSSNMSWILRKWSTQELLRLMESFGSTLLFGEGSVPEEDILNSGLDRPRRLLASIHVLSAKPDGVATVKALVAALEEDIYVMDGSEAGTRDETIAKDFVCALHQNPALSHMAFELIDKSKFRMRFGRERAKCLSYLGRHRDALNILVYELNDCQGAETYCAEHESKHSYADSSAGGNTDPFSCLLAIHLERFAESSTTPSSVKAQAALSFMTRHAHRLKPLEVVRAIPEHLPLPFVMKFVDQAIRASSSARRAARVHKNLARSENFQNKYKLMQAEQEFFFVTSETQCVKCLRKIDDPTTSLIRDPQSGAVYHLECPVQSAPTAPTARSKFLTTTGNPKPISFEEGDWKQLH